MRIRILQTISSSEGWSFDPGVIVNVGTEFISNVEVPGDVAAKWLAGGAVAEEVIDEPLRIASDPDGEIATTRGRKRGK